MIEVFMNNKLLIDVQRTGTKVALIEDGSLAEFYIEKKGSNSIVGNIYKGRVVNLLAGMQAAFVDIGLDKNAFLYVGDMLVDRTELVDQQLSLPQKLLVKEGDLIMVQVVKDRMGTKGPRVTCSITLPGRLLVLMPEVNYIGISKKITSDKLREKLYGKIKKIKPEGMGFIVRTAAASASTKEIKAEAEYLIKLWTEISKNYEKAQPFEILHLESDLICRTFRDIVSSDLNEIVVNDVDAKDRILKILKAFMPKAVKNIKFFPRSRDMFFDYGVSEQVDNMLKARVRLESGAYLIIDKTEALTVIDVNTGKYVGQQNLEETVYNTNLLAAKEIARQLRLRNIGGIIICDFIDMEQPEHRENVVSCLENETKKDRVKTTVVGMSGLGLIEITRKKTRNEVSSVLLQDCPYCGGDGYIYSYDHIINKIEIAIINSLEKPDVRGLLITLNPILTEYIFKNRIFSDTGKGIIKGQRIYLSSDFKLHLEKFRIAEFTTNEFDLPSNAMYLVY
jgi:ribonuclease G